MERLILIETSTALCSAAICEKGGIIAYRESNAPKSHASLTAVFIDEMLKENGLQLAGCDGVCVSMGPGSYTGLRVGVSTAKGLCFGGGLPLLAVGTLDTLVAQAVAQGAVQCRRPDGTAVEMPVENFTHIVPMIDARRMEVYTGEFSRRDPGMGSGMDSGLGTGLDSGMGNSRGQVAGDCQGADGFPGANGCRDTTDHRDADDRRDANDRRMTKGPYFIQTTETEPHIVTPESFLEPLAEGPVLFIGDGALKCADIITSPNAFFLQCCPKASSMAAPATEAFRKKEFRDVAYFEPFYLKEFTATVSRKKLF